MEYSIGHTIRSKKGRRIVYQPDWSQSQPWAYYHTNGDAGRHFPSVEAAQEYCTNLQDPLVLGVLHDQQSKTVN